MVIVQSGAGEQLIDEGIGYVSACIEVFVFSILSLRFPIRVETAEMVKEHFLGTRIPKRKLIP